MTAKQYLNRIRNLELRIAVKRRDLEDLREKARSVTGAAGETSKTAGGDRLGEIAARIVDLEREIMDDAMRYVELRAQTTAYIDMIPDARYVDILYRRYVHGQTWERIAEETGYTLRWVYILHGRALESFGSVMNRAL